MESKMTVREFFAWALAATSTILVVLMLVIQILAVRLDWLAFGSSYEADKAALGAWQGQIVQVINQLAKNSQAQQTPTPTKE